jgi:hypothetical protein
VGAVPQVSGLTPTFLSLRQLRAEGWTVDVCERWVPSGNIGQVRKDLFGLVDLVAVRGPVTMGVQTTSHSNAHARIKKMLDADHRPLLDALQTAGWVVVVHGWRLSTRNGHACQHGKTPCACIWTLHHLVTLSELP